MHSGVGWGCCSYAPEAVLAAGGAKTRYFLCFPILIKPAERSASVLHYESALDKCLEGGIVTDDLVQISISPGIPFLVVCLPLLWRSDAIILIAERIRPPFWSPFEWRRRSSRFSRARCDDHLSLASFSGGRSLAPQCAPSGDVQPPAPLAIHPLGTIQALLASSHTGVVFAPEPAS
jgi:hypothetical protein